MANLISDRFHRLHNEQFEDIFFYSIDILTNLEGIVSFSLWQSLLHGNLDEFGEPQKSKSGLFFRSLTGLTVFGSHPTTKG